MNRMGFVILSGAAVVIIGTTTAATFAATHLSADFYSAFRSGRSMMSGFGGTPSTSTGYGSMMGRGMMGSAMMGNNASAVLLPAAAKRTADMIPVGAMYSTRTNTLTFHTQSVHLTPLASPDGSPDMTFQVVGHTDPTIVVPQGARITVQLINADQGTMHGWTVTTASPPYSTMAMMQAPVAFSGAFAMPIPGAQTNQWVDTTISFTANAPGTYHYLCPAPGHAARGMYGTLIVR